MFNTPILLIIFNRPDKIKALIASLSEIKPKKLYISADGPREKVKNDKEKCEESRKIVTEISWPCEIHTNFLEKNIGVDLGMESAINWFFENVEEGIILEDDCIPNNDYFIFASELLKRYRTNDKIMLISGTNFQDGTMRGKGSYYFSNYPTWGYAMWRRTWNKFDSKLDGLDDFINNNKIDKILKDPKQKKFWLTFFSKIKSGKYNFTDSRLAFSIWNNGGITIIPNKNLIKNIGFDIDATHTTTGGEGRSISSTRLGKIIFDDNIIINYEADNYYFNKIIKLTLYEKIKYKINQFTTKIKRLII